MRPIMSIFKRLMSVFAVGSASHGAQDALDASPAPQPVPEEWGRSGEPPTWDVFFDTQLPRVWSDELKEALSTRDEKLWRLVGTCLLLQIEEPEEGARILHRTAVDAGFNFFRVPSAEVESLAEDPRGRFSSVAPALVMLDYGEWIQSVPGLIEMDTPGTSSIKMFVKNLMRFDVANPILFAVCRRESEAVSEEIQKIGGFDRTFVLEPPAPDFLGRRFLELLGTDVASESLRRVPSKVGLMIQSEFAEFRSQELAVLNLQRLSRRERRVVDFNDLANLALRGKFERNPGASKASSEQLRRKVAYHEAGHACVAVIASGGANIPDYASIVPASTFNGVVMQSLAYHDQQDEITFQNLLLSTRISLAGRAAEEFFFGPTNVSSGANSDLNAATRRCFWLFAYSGFNSEMEKERGSASNLAVLDRGDVDPVQNDRISSDVRQFLADQYDYVLHTLDQHRKFVDAVAERLLWDPVIDQGEMLELASAHGLMPQPLRMQ